MNKGKTKTKTKDTFSLSKKFNSIFKDHWSKTKSISKSKRLNKLNKCKKITKKLQKRKQNLKINKKLIEDRSFHQPL